MLFRKLPCRLDCFVAFQFKYFQKEIDECWPWAASINKDGYGQLHINGQNYKASRISFYLYNNNIDNTLDVCHSCDNPICVNPKHLWQGTRSNNVQDAMCKNRWPNRIGENNGRSKLTENQIIEIRIKWETTKYTLKQLGNEYNVSDKYISKIIRKELWKHI